MISRSVGAFSQREMVGCAEVTAAVRQPSAGQLECRIEAQPVKVVAIGIAATNRQHAGAQHIRNRVRDVRGIAMVGNKSGKRINNCTPAIGECEQHHAAIRGKSPPSNAAAWRPVWPQAHPDPTSTSGSLGASRSGRSLYRNCPQLRGQSLDDQSAGGRRQQRSKVCYG
jgi:hypothetical protein